MLTYDDYDQNVHMIIYDDYDQNHISITMLIEKQWTESQIAIPEMFKKIFNSLWLCFETPPN